jgi:hypothetical protein
MRRRTSILLFACAACAAVLAFGLRRAGPLEEPDEAAWIFSSYAFRLAFLTPGGLSSTEWKDADALDHPPIAKIYFGAFLAPAGLLPDSLADKRLWFDRAFLPYDHAAFVAALRERISARALFLGRLANSAAILLACALVALVGAEAVSAEAGAAAALLLVLAAVARAVAAQAVADGLFLALELACAAAQAFWAADLARERRFCAARSLLCGALAGALFDVKISGALELALLAAAVAAALTAAPRSKPLRGAAAASLATAAAAAAFVAVALNPSLYREPCAFVLAMFRHRRETVALQSLVYFGGELQNPLYRICGVLRGLFSPEGGACIGAATAVLACAGAADARRRVAAAPVFSRVIVVHGAAWTAATLAVYRLDWPRYVLPALPFICLLAARGAARLAVLRPGARARPALLAVAAATALIVPARVFTPLSYWFDHPEAYRRKIDAQIPYLLARYPNDRPLILRGEADSRALLERLRGAP